MNWEAVYELVGEGLFAAGNLGFQYYGPKPSKPARPLGDRDTEDSAERAEVANLGEVIQTQENFLVTAHVYDEGPRENLQLVIHLDGVAARVIQ